jgi:hypothetical protein
LVGGGWWVVGGGWWVVGGGWWVGSGGWVVVGGWWWWWWCRWWVCVCVCVIVCVIVCGGCCCSCCSVVVWVGGGGRWLGGWVGFGVLLTSTGGQCTSASGVLLGKKKVPATQLSPLYLGPVSDCDGESAARFENLWQYRKVYEQLGHWDAQSQRPTPEWDRWRRSGYTSLKSEKRTGRRAKVWVGGWGGVGSAGDSPSFAKGIRTPKVILNGWFLRATFIILWGFVFVH